VRTGNRASPERERADLVHLCTVIIGIERSPEPCGIGVLCGHAGAHQSLV